MNDPLQVSKPNGTILYEASQKNRFYSLATLACFLFASIIGCGGINANKKKEMTTMEKRIINPWTWQDKFGFVQANEITNAQRILYTAGIVSVDEEGHLLHAGSMEKQINQIFDNLESLLEQADLKLSDVVRFTYYTTDVQAFIKADQTLIERLRKGGCKPATSLIGVNALFHPDCVVEIEATAVD